MFNGITCKHFKIIYWIRVTPESDIEDDLDGSVLSLGLFPGEYLKTKESGANASAASKFQFLVTAILYTIEV